MADRTQERPRLRFWLLAIGVLLLAAAAVQHQVHFWRWYIEDAAISFAYARNWADGHGLVALPDSERLEGYSNFTWVSLLAIGQWLGFDSFASSKWMQTVLGFVTVVLTALLAREASPHRNDGTPIIAAAYLATASTFAVWGACGLENSLFSLLMAAALLRTAVELRTEARLPWSAALWFLLAISRPEAVLYCAIAGFLTMVFTLHRGIRPTLAWLGIFFVPFALYHAIRFNYFAYEFPQTYYGKMATKEPTPLAWNRRGWKQVRSWSQTLWTGYYLPIWFLGLVGWRGAKGAITAGLLLVCGFWLLAPELLPTQPYVVGAYEIAPLLLPQDFPDGWAEGRSYLMVFSAVFLPLLALGHRRGWGAWALAIGAWSVAPFALAQAAVGLSRLGTWSLLCTLPALFLVLWRLGPTLLWDPPPVHTQVRVLCWGVASGVLFFAIYTQGDWMKAWRWMSLLQVPLAVAFATGVATFADATDAALHRVRGQLSEVLVSTTVWSIALLIAVALPVFFGARFAYGQGWALAIAAGSVCLALPLGLARHRLGMPWTAAGWSVVALITALTAFPNLDYTKSLNQRPETGPFSVKKRVDFVSGVREKLELEHRIVDLDVDQGAHLWWGRDTFRMMDIAGLVDIPFAQHRFKRPFIHEYLYEEKRPHYIHLHGGWATNSRIKTHPEWRRQYLEMPGFPAGSKNLHIGNFIRRDLFLKPTYDGERVPLQDGVTFHGFDIPSEPGANRTLWLEVAVQDIRKRPANAPLEMLVLVAQDGAYIKSWSVPLGYGWMLPEEWRPDEIFVGHFNLPTRGLEPGTYDIGFILYADKQPLQRTDLAPTDPPLFAPGAFWFPGELVVVSADEAQALADADLKASEQQANSDECETAAQSWLRARRHQPINKKFREQHQADVHARIAHCWAARAEDAQDPLYDLEQARLWNHLDPLYRSLRTPVAEQLVADGSIAMDQQDWETAYQKFSAALRIDPTQAWARRWAEQARSVRLNLPAAHRKGR